MQLLKTVNNTIYPCGTDGSMASLFSYSTMPSSTTARLRLQAVGLPTKEAQLVDVLKTDVTVSVFVAVDVTVVGLTRKRSSPLTLC